MGKKDKFQERKEYKREIKGVEIKQSKKAHLIVLSFRDFDRNQGQNFEEWEEEKLLGLAINRLRDICQLTKVQAIKEQKVKEYDSFPSHTEFYHPKHISSDVKWSSIRVQGKERIVGYFEDHIFNIVFLDKDHKFWITEKKNT